MTLSELRSEELEEQLWLYMASPEGGIRPEIHALWSFWLHSIRDSNGKIGVASSDGYDVANLFWDLYEPSQLVPKLDEDIIESLEYHVLLSSRAWSFDSAWPEDCKKWVSDQINRLTETRRRIINEPIWDPNSAERLDHIGRTNPLVAHIHNAEHIRSQSLSMSDSDCEEFILEYLHWLYDCYKVSYEPDGESGGAFCLDAYLHIAAARAFRIKRNQGLSDDVRDCLTEVERIVKRIEAEGSLNSEEIVAPCHSTQAVAALAYVELSRISRVDSEFAKALHYLAEAVRHYDFVAMSNEELISKPDYMRFLYDEHFDTDLRLRRKLEGSLTGLQVSMDEAARVFRSIKENASDDIEWNHVADDCTAMQFAWFISGREEDITDERGNIVTWSEFWAAADAWATVKLSPDEYRKMREDDERHAAESRLKNYFFESGWSSLSERAQERLISADRDWISQERVSKEAILRHLLRATEQMCFDFIWRPLEECVAHGNNLPEFTNRMSELALKRRAPSVHDYSWACQSVFCQQSFAQGILSSGDIDFIRNRLPKAMRRLNRVSGSADHEPDGYEVERSFSHDDLRSLFQEFIGIGQPGVLPELSRIGRKLQGHRR